MKEDIRKGIMRDFDSIKTLDDCLKRFGDIPFWGERIKVVIDKHEGKINLNDN